VVICIDCCVQFVVESDSIAGALDVRARCGRGPDGANLLLCIAGQVLFTVLCNLPLPLPGGVVLLLPRLWHRI